MWNVEAPDLHAFERVEVLFQLNNPYIPYVAGSWQADEDGVFPYDIQGWGIDSGNIVRWMPIPE